FPECHGVLPPPAALRRLQLRSRLGLLAFQVECTAILSAGRCRPRFDPSPVPSGPDLSRAQAFPISRYARMIRLKCEEHKRNRLGAPRQFESANRRRASPRSVFRRARWYEQAPANAKTAREPFWVFRLRPRHKWF